MIEVSYWLDGVDLILTTNFYFRVKIGDTVMVENVLYEVNTDKGLDIKKNKDGSISVEQNVIVKELF
jgi:hypothetical protein